MSGVVCFVASGAPEGGGGGYDQRVNDGRFLGAVAEETVPCCFDMSPLCLSLFELRGAK